MNHTPKFTLDDQYKAYLEKSGREEAKMPLAQRIETKKAFVAGFSSLLRLLPEIGKMDNENMQKCFSSLNNDIVNFYLSQN